MTHCLRRCGAFTALAVLALLVGCQTPTADTQPAFPTHRPTSILVLPPVNESPDVNATYSLLSHVSLPLSESGYYVLPVAMVFQTFIDNGFTEPAQIHSIPRQKLGDIFGADAVLYLKILHAGTQYKIIVSDTRVTAQAQLVDLRTGALLWRGQATASSTENSSSSGGIVGMLVQAVVEQVINTTFDRSHDVAKLTALRLFHPHSPIAPPPGPLRTIPE